jgi:hypothetical protein
MVIDVNTDDDDTNPKKFELPTIESKVTRRGGATLASDNGSNAHLKRH